MNAVVGEHVIYSEREMEIVTNYLERHRANLDPRYRWCSVNAAKVAFEIENNPGKRFARQDLGERIELPIHTLASAVRELRDLKLIKEDCCPYESTANLKPYMDSLVRTARVAQQV